MAKVPIMDTDSLRSWHKKEEGREKCKRFECEVTTSSA